MILHYQKWFSPLVNGTYSFKFWIFFIIKLYNFFFLIEISHTEQNSSDSVLNDKLRNFDELSVYNSFINVFEFNVHEDLNYMTEVF